MLGAMTGVADIMNMHRHDVGIRWSRIQFGEEFRLQQVFIVKNSACLWFVRLTSARVTCGPRSAVHARESDYAVKQVQVFPALQSWLKYRIHLPNLIYY